MPSYRVELTSAAGDFICSATLRCPDDEIARQRFHELRLTAHRAELRRGARLVAARTNPNAELFTAQRRRPGPAFSQAASSR